MFKRLTAIFLSAVLAFSLAGCTFSTPAVVMTVDGEDVAAGIYLIYQFGAYADARSKAADFTKDVFKQEIDGKSAESWIYDETVARVKTHIYVERAFAESGLSFTDDMLTSYTAQLETSWTQNEKELTKNGIGKASYIAYNMNEAKKSLLFSDKFVADTANAVTDASARAYMEEKYSRIASVTLPVTTSDYKELDADKTAEIKKLADELLAKANAGEALDAKTAEPILQKAFTVTGREYSAEASASYIAKNFIHAASTTYPEELVKKLVTAKVGDTGIDEVYGAPFVWSKVDTVENDEEFESYKPSIVNEMQSKVFEDQMKAVTDAYTVTPSEKAVKAYSPKNIKQS